MMKSINTILKVISALAAVVGAVYIVAVYGDKIVAWAKQLMGYNTEPVATLHFTTPESADKPEDAPASQAEDAAPAEEAPSETAPAAEAAPEAPAAEESIPVANEEDFEG